MHKQQIRTHKCPEQSRYPEGHATTVATKGNVLNYTLGDFDCGDISRYFTVIDVISFPNIKPAVFETEQDLRQSFSRNSAAAQIRQL